MIDLKEILNIAIGVAIAMIVVNIISKQFPKLSSWESEEIA